MELRAGLLRAGDDPAAVLPAVDDGELPGHRDLEDDVLGGDLEPAVVDVGVRERRLEDGLRDRVGELVGALQRVAAGDVARLRLGLALEDDHVEALAGRRGRGVAAARAGADDHHVGLVGGHWPG